MSDTETQKQKEYITLEGKIIEAKRASAKAPFSIVMINDADIKKYVLNAWKTLADELEVLQIQSHDEIRAEVYDYKGIDKYKTTFYGSEVLQYNLHSSENILAINNNIILEMNSNKLQDNIKQITAEHLLLEDEINRNAEEEAKKVVNSLPIKNNLTREERNILDAKPIEKTKELKKKKKEIDKDLVTVQPKNTAIVEFDKNEIAFRNSTVAITFNTIKEYFDPEKKCTDQDIIVFWSLCKNYQLDPFKRDIYLVKMSERDKAANIVSKDLFLSRAELQPDYLGFQAGIITEYEGPDNIIEKMRDGCYLPKSEKLVGGWCKVFRKNKQNFTHTIGFDEAKRSTSQWTKMPAIMVRKVAIVQAIRECYPNYFAQLYDASEMGVELPKEE